MDYNQIHEHRERPENRGKPGTLTTFSGFAATPHPPPERFAPWADSKAAGDQSATAVFNFGRETGGGKPGTDEKFPAFSRQIE